MALFAAFRDLQLETNLVIPTRDDERSNGGARRNLLP